jgi:hypothetical protein
MQPALLVLALQVLRWPVHEPPQVDGRLDEAFWQVVPEATEFYQVLPQAGAPAPFKTSVRLARDDHSLYIGALMEDPPGAERQSNVSRRDHIASSDDSLTLILDPEGTRVFGQVFQVNPDCSINDGLYKEATLSIDLSVDYFHTVACERTATGWSVEWQIPLQELRFAQDQQKPWNLLVQRSMVRDQRRMVANAPLPRDPLCLLCLAPALDNPEPLPEPRFFHSTPYAMARRTDKVRISNGVDIKYRVNAASILDATINPDFSQVTLDEPQLSANTRFAVAFPENRPFFLEGADILETPLKVVATRSIAQPSWGLKYTNRSASNDTMILIGDDRSANRILLPGAYRSRFQAIQARQKFVIGSTQWKADAWQLGLTWTSRSYEDFGSNQTLGLTAMHYLSREDSLRWQSILSHSHDAWDSPREKSGDAHFLLFQHKGEVWHSSLELKSFSDAFRSDLGFNPRNAYKLGILTNSWHQDWDETHLAFYLRASRKTELSPRPIQNQTAPGVTITGLWGSELTLETRPDTWERTQEDGPLHRYQQHYFSLGVYPGSLLTWLQCDLTWGERLDVTDDRVRPGRVESCTARLALAKKLEWNARVSQEYLNEEHWQDSEHSILVNRALRHLVVVPLHSRLALRYIRQEEKAKRIGLSTSRTTTDSWNISYENHESLNVQAGATISRKPQETLRDYYLKLSTSLPWN